jgi:large subunit ribosomal protein L18
MASSPLKSYYFRKIRVRKKVFGTPERPRLSVYRSLKNIYAQVIDDTKGRTLAFASSLDSSIREQKKSGGNKDSALMVGHLIAERSGASKIKKVVFDRGGRIFHGCVKAVADGAREKGLEF